MFTQKPYNNLKDEIYSDNNNDKGIWIITIIFIILFCTFVVTDIYSKTHETQLINLREMNQ